MDVALATCERLPEPDFDEKPMLEALRARGLEAGSLAWDDPEVDWWRPRLTVLRSTWNYPQHPDAFRAWAESTATKTALWNPWPAVRWNVHKGYLLELDRAGSLGLRDRGGRWFGGGATTVGAGVGVEADIQDQLAPGTGTGAGATVSRTFRQSS